jgi:glycosyltransferase involved in cell wall biosynthesis
VRLLASRIAVVSSAAGDALGSRESVIVHNGLTLPEAAAGNPEGPPIVSYVGRLTRLKGTDVLLRAFALIAAEHPAARLVLCGSEFSGRRCRRSLETAAALGFGERLTILPFTGRRFLARSTVGGPLP